MKKHKYYEAIIAYAEGKTIQYRADDMDEWRDTITPAFSINTQYREKPEPKIIPFDFDSAKQNSIIGKTVESIEGISRRGSREVSIITSFYEGNNHKGEKILWLTVSNAQLTAEELLSNYQFTNREPCGVIKQ